MQSEAMKKHIILFVIAVLPFVCSCSWKEENPYLSTLCRLTVAPDYPDGVETREGVTVVASNTNTGDTYSRPTNVDGKAEFSLPTGLYKITVSDIRGKDIYNGMKDNIELKSAGVLHLDMKHSLKGSLIIKEIYCGGCMKTPEQGNYQADKYIIIHNNDFEDHYLDSLCFGALFPWNSNASNPFLTDGNLPSFLPVGQAIWQFGGTGSSFKLAPGEDAVLCLNGAINHSALYPLSVNLDVPGYFVCYSPVYFPNTSYHPAPGANIAQDHYVDAIIKTGSGNAYTFSINSPTAIIFRAPEGKTIQQYVAEEGSIVQVPGSSSDKVVSIPPEWVIDAVEVFNGASSGNQKRLMSTLDAGYVTLSGTYLGHTLMRKLDREQTDQAGYDIYQDTNNSSADFEERTEQSLHAKNGQ